MPGKCYRFVKSLTVEPSYCLYTIVFVIVDTAYTNLLLQKTCRFNCTSEPDLRTPCDDEKLGVLFASEINSFYRLGMFTLCTIYSMMALGWSDIAGRRRRPLILLPIIGLIFQSSVGCLHAYFWTWSPLSGVLSNIACEVLSGGMSLLTVSIMTYMCDVTDSKTRTMGLGLLSACRVFGDLVGFGSAGFILRSLGFFYTFALGAVLASVTLVSALIFVRDISVPVVEKPQFFEIFNAMRIVDSCKVVYKKSLGSDRIVISMLFVIFTAVFFTIQGNIFCAVILSRILEIHDGLIGLFAGCWDIVAAFGYLFASRNWHLYIIPIFDMFHGTAFTASSAFYTKYYPSDEFGRLHCFLGFFALIIPICYPAYNEIFQRTLDNFPSAYFILSISTNVVVVFLYCFSYFLSKKFQNRKPFEKEQHPMLITESEAKIRTSAKN